MKDDIKDFWDNDISELQISGVEKNGLQVYRNYSESFEKFRAKKFSDSVNEKKFPLDDLENILDLITTEESKFLPVLVCAFVDEYLDKMFRREVPEGVPGGKNNLFTGYGPLTNLSSRIRIAYSFDFLSKDLLTDTYKLKKIRNDISHNWKIGELNDWFKFPVIRELEEIERYLIDHEKLPKNFYKTLDALETIRIRLIWIVCRIFYETLLYNTAKNQKLDPILALYGEEHPKLLTHISGSAILFTKKIIKNPNGGE